jgi:hypothetical protein
LTCFCPLAAIRAGDEEAIQRLIQIIQDPDRSHDSKAGAISSLAYHRERAADAVPVLKSLLASKESPELSHQSISTLVAIGEKGVPILAAELRVPYSVPLAKARSKAPPPSNWQQIRDEIELKKVLVLGLERIGSEKKLGSEADTAAKVLMEVVESPTGWWGPGSGSSTEQLRVYAARALGIVVPRKEAAAAAVVLSKLLADPSLGVGAAEGLAKMGARAKPATGKLVEFLDQSLAAPDAQNINNIRACMFALQSIGPEAKEALPTLRAFMKFRGLDNDAERAIQAIKGS